MNITENRNEVGRDLFFRELSVGDIVAFTSGSTASMVIGKIQEISKTKKTCSMLVNNGTNIVKRRCPDVMKIEEILSIAKDENPEYFI
jgi:hypothetical protein